MQPDEMQATGTGLLWLGFGSAMEATDLLKRDQDLRVTAACGLVLVQRHPSLCGPRLTQISPSAALPLGIRDVSCPRNQMAFLGSKVPYKV